MRVFDPGPWLPDWRPRPHAHRDIRRAVWAILALLCAIGLILVMLCVA